MAGSHCKSVGPTKIGFKRSPLNYPSVTFENRKDLDYDYSMEFPKLTETTKKGGCAAKLPAGQLREILSKIKIIRPKELLVGSETLDDAALWELPSGDLLIQNVSHHLTPERTGRSAAR